MGSKEGRSVQLTLLPSRDHGRPCPHSEVGPWHWFLYRESGGEKCIMKEITNSLRVGSKPSFKMKSVKAGEIQVNKMLPWHCYQHPHACSKVSECLQKVWNKQQAKQLLLELWVWGRIIPDFMSSDVLSPWAVLTDTKIAEGCWKTSTCQKFLLATFYWDYFMNISWLQFPFSVKWSSPSKSDSQMRPPGVLVQHTGRFIKLPLIRYFHAWPFPKRVHTDGYNMLYCSLGVLAPTETSFLWEGGEWTCPAKLPSWFAQKPPHSLSFRHSKLPRGLRLVCL